MSDYFLLPGRKLGDAISEAEFGMRYVSFDNFNRFRDQTKDLNLGHITWPGGRLAEIRTDRYGLEYENLYNPEIDRPGFREIAAHAREEKLALTIPLPTARYVGDITTMRSHVESFFTKLLDGAYGRMPKKLTFEIGSEFYASFRDLELDGRSAAQAYGELANEMLRTIADIVGDHGPSDVSFTLSIQMGRSSLEGDEIRSELSKRAFAQIDYVTHHRFTDRIEQNDDFIRFVEREMDIWHDRIERAGGSTPELLFSAWNSSIAPRHEALATYISLMKANYGVIVEPASIDLEGRSNTGFEQFWQTGVLIGPDGESKQINQGLARFDFGLAQAVLLLDMFAQYTSLGLGAAATYGADVIHAGRHTYRLDGEDYYFVGYGAQKLMYESLAGTRPVEISIERQSDRTDSLDVDYHVFENKGRYVVFASIKELNGHGDDVSVSVSLAGFGGFRAVWQDNLTSVLPEDWMSKFDVPDNPIVDESLEGRAYELANIDSVRPNIWHDEISLRFNQDYQIIRLIVARSEEAVAEIAEWAGRNFKRSEMENDTRNEPEELLGSIEDDVFIVTHVQDQVMEVPNGGEDRIKSLVDYDLRSARWVEALELESGNARAGLGNSLDNWIEGNRVSNKIKGRAGDDRLESGFDGRDHLFGGLGSDVLVSQGSSTSILDGGRGDDVYILRGGSAKIRESEGQGIDLIKSTRTLDLRDHTQNVEDVLLLGESNISAHGNRLGNFLSGNGASNLLDGRYGDDFLLGRKGDDTMIGGRGDDVIRGGSGRDVFVFAPDDGADTVLDFQVGEDQFYFVDHRSSDVTIISQRNSVVVEGKGFQVLIHGADTSVEESFLFL